MSTLSTNFTKENTGLGPGILSATEQRHISERTSDIDESKTYASLRANFAMAGHTFHRAVNADSTIVFLAGRCGYFKEMKNLEAASAFLILIGGAV